MASLSSAQSKYIFGGMLWALTEKGRDVVLENLGLGMNLDLAFGVMDEQVKMGVYQESEIYALPDKEDVK